MKIESETEEGNVQRTRVSYSVVQGSSIKVRQWSATKEGACSAVNDRQDSAGEQTKDQGNAVALAGYRGLCPRGCTVPKQLRL